MASITSTRRLSYSVILSESEVLGTWSSCLIDKVICKQQRVDWYGYVGWLQSFCLSYSSVDCQDNELSELYLFENRMLEREIKEIFIRKPGRMGEKYTGSS